MMAGNFMGAPPPRTGGGAAGVLGGSSVPSGPKGPAPKARLPRPVGGPTASGTIKPRPIAPVSTGLPRPGGPPVTSGRTPPMPARPPVMGSAGGMRPLAPMSPDAQQMQQRMAAAKAAPPPATSAMGGAGGMGQRFMFAKGGKVMATGDRGKYAK